MKRLVAIVVILAALPLAGCGQTVQERIKLMKECSALGGTYTESAAPASTTGKCEIKPQGENRG